ALAKLSPDEDARLAFLERSLLDLLANDPAKLVQQLTLRIVRVQALIRHLRETEAALSDVSLNRVLETRTEGRRRSEEARRLREATFPTGVLTGTGTEAWTALWEAARRFSEEQVYQTQKFPVVNDGAQCVL